MIRNEVFTYKDPEDYPNQYALEMYRAIDTLESITIAESLYEKNLQTKLNMIHKINSEYGKLNRGIENYCRIQSLEAENDANNGGNNNNNNSSNNNNSNNNQNNNNSPEEQKKKINLKEMLTKVQQAIANVIQKIFDWIVNLINKFRYNNKVFEATINAVNNAPAEELNKVSDDIKTVEFDAKNIIDISKHPEQNLNKFIGQYQTICDVLNNAINSVQNNPKDLTRIKDFSAKLHDFVKNIPDVGNSCPQIQGDGEGALKQYGDSLKTYCSSTLNYQKMTKSFNKYFAGADTYEGKMTASKIVNTNDPKAIITLIKTESEEIGKLNDSLKKINDNNKKINKDVISLIGKAFTSGEDSKIINSQVQMILSCERAITQLNSVFSGICANSIKSINLVKGKLIDSVKKNIKGNNNKEENNTQNNKENKKSNENLRNDMLSTEECHMFDVQYDLNTYAKSVEGMLDRKFAEMYSLEYTIDPKYATATTGQVYDRLYATAGKKTSRFDRVIKTLGNIIETIFTAFSNLVITIVDKITEMYRSHKLNSMADKDKANMSLQFAKKAQNAVKSMKDSTTKLSRIAKATDKVIDKRNDDSIRNSSGEKLIKMSLTLKMFIILEKVVVKTFNNFRSAIINGGLKRESSTGSIEQFVVKYNSIASQVTQIIENASRDDKEVDDKLMESIKTTKDFIDETLKSAHISMSKIGINFSNQYETSGYDVNNAIKLAMEGYENILSDRRNLNLLGIKLFGFSKESSEIDA